MSLRSEQYTHTLTKFIAKMSVCVDSKDIQTVPPATAKKHIKGI